MWLNSQENLTLQQGLFNMMNISAKPEDAIHELYLIPISSQLLDWMFSDPLFFAFCLSLKKVL